MKRLFFVAATFLFALGAGVTQAAQQYIQSPPLSQVVKTQVGACSDKLPTEIPLITWGGDIATIHANGGANTKAGSVFANEGLSLTLVREDVFSRQVENYLSCKSPFLRGTMGMLSMAAGVTEQDPRTKMVVVYQMTWSAGGDALVVKAGIGKPADLKGKTIALQAYGPHVEYLTKMLTDAGLSLNDVTVKWTKDLTGPPPANTPGGALRSDPSVDAAFVIIPDALALTSGGTVGTGAEDSVKGVEILLSTKTANRIIADVYAVRKDYFDANRANIQKFVHGLMVAEEELQVLMDAKDKPAAYKPMIAGAAKILLDAEQAVADTEGMYADAEFVGWKGNVKFFGDPNYPRRLDALSGEIQSAFVPLGLLSAKATLVHARWDYAALAAGLRDTSGVPAPKFNQAAVANVITKMQAQDTLDENALFSFTVRFETDKSDIDPKLYKEAFNKVIEYASVYGGAIVVVEGHTDPNNYARKKARGASPLVLQHIETAARNLSKNRANAVRNALVKYATEKGVALDPSQFDVVGHSFTKPITGMCGDNYCYTENETEWRAKWAPQNMRAVFQIIAVEAEGF